MLSREGFHVKNWTALTAKSGKVEDGYQPPEDKGDKLLHRLLKLQSYNKAITKP
jgi:hypothetical protein